MEYSNFKSTLIYRNKYYRMPRKRAKVFRSSILLNLVRLLNIIWSRIQCLMARRKNVYRHVIFMTGIAGQMGRGLAVALHRLGAKTVCVDRDGKGGDPGARAVREERGTADVAGGETIAAVADAAKSDFGRRTDETGADKHAVLKYTAHRMISARAPMLTLLE